MRPVSSLDQTGTSFSAISNAPDDMSCKKRFWLKVFLNWTELCGFYLSLDHVAQEEDHHAGVHFVFGAPAPPGGCGRPKESENVKVGHQGDDHEQFCDQQDLREVHVESWRIVVATLDLDLRILFVNYVVVFIKSLSVTARIAVNIWLAFPRVRQTMSYQPRKITATLLSLPIKESHGGPIAADILAKLGDWNLLLGTSGGRSQAEQHCGHANYRQQGEMFPAKRWCPHDDDGSAVTVTTSVD